MKKIAGLVIAVFLMGTFTPFAAADDVLKKMRAFKAVMDTLPETMKEEEEELEAPVVVTPEPVKEDVVEPMIEEKRYPWEAKSKEMEQEVAPVVEDMQEEVEAESWDSYRGYESKPQDYGSSDTTLKEDLSEEVTDSLRTDIDAIDTSNLEMTSEDVVEDMIDSEEESISDVSTSTNNLKEDVIDIVDTIKDTEETESIAEVTDDTIDMSDEAELIVEETSYDWDEEVVEMKIDENVQETAEGIQELLKTGLSDMDATAKDVMDLGGEYQEDREALNESTEAIDFELSVDVEDTVEEIEMKMNSTVDSTVESTDAISESVSSTESKKLGMILDQPHVTKTDEPEIMQYRQDLTQELTPEILDRHVHIDQMKSEIDAEIEEIQSDIELITGISKDNSESLTEDK